MARIEGMEQGIEANRTQTSANQRLEAEQPGLAHANQRLYDAHSAVNELRILAECIKSCLHGVMDKVVIMEHMAEKTEKSLQNHNPWGEVTATLYESDRSD